MQATSVHTSRWLRTLEILAVLALVLCALGLIRTPWTGQVSLLERLTHFRFYWLGILVALAAWWGLRRSWTLAAGCVALLFWGATSLWPYYQRPGVGEAPPGRALTVTSFNLYADNERPEAALAWIEAQSADVIVLTEYSRTWHRRFQKRAKAWPHRVECLRDSTSGICLLSRHPLDEPMAEGMAPSEKRPWICTVAHTPVGDVRVLGLHPRTPRGGSRIDERNAQLATAARLAAASAEPFVLLGDLNCSPFSPCFAEMLEAGGLRDSALGFGLPPTWRSGVWWLPIDHILVSSPWQVKARRVFTGDLGSDHFPVTAELGLR